MMRFDPSKWGEISVDQVFSVHSGSIRLNCTDRVRLYVRTAECSDWILVGSQYSFDVDLIGATGVEAVIDGHGDVRAFLYQERPHARPSRDGVFTNPDRAEMGMQSDAYAAVAAAMRVFRIEQLERDRLASAKLKSHLAARKAAADDAPVEVPPSVDDEPPAA